MKVQHTATLDFTDNGVFETGWRIKQGDYGNTELVLRLVNNGVNVYDAGITPQIAFRRWDGASVISVMTPNDQTYKYAFAGNELEVPGLTLCDVKFTDAEGRVSTASCRFTVVEDTIGYDPTGAHTYDNPVSELVEQATAAAETAIDSSFKAEGFAVGEQGGEPVGPDSPYYKNNAKYYGELINNYESDGYLSIQRAFKEELGHSIYTYNTGIPTINNSYLGIQKKYPVKSGDVVYLKFETTATNPWYAITHYDSNGNYTGVLSQGYGTEVKLTMSYSGFISFVLWSSNAEFLPSSVSEFKLYTNYVTPNNKLTDISATGTDESGRTTASKAYAIGEHFYKDGKFCTAKTAIASGATFTLNTNYVEGDVASTIDAKSTNQLTADSGGVLNSQACVTLGHIFIAVYVLTANDTTSVVSGFPTLVTGSNAPTALIRSLSNGQVVTTNNYIVNGKHTMGSLTLGTAYSVTIIGII